MTFDGPGQGSSLFEKNIYFRYDWEKVITPVIDSVIHRPDVDKNKMVLIGVSQGGYWVPRAAAFEKRIKVLIPDPGCNRCQQFLAQSSSTADARTVEVGQQGSVQRIIWKPDSNNLLLYSPLYAFRSRPYGKDNPFDVYTEVMKYNLNGIAAKITCPVIIPSPENETFWPGQSQALFDMLTSPKQLISFTAAEGANYHCEPKARLHWEQKVLDTLDEVMKDSSKGPA